MKRAVLNTLLQAVKAIKGGVLALKGQLIKGGGYLLVGGGKLVKAKGEVITNLGKKIARTAFRDMHSSEVHEGNLSFNFDFKCIVTFCRCFLWSLSSLGS